MWIFSIFSRQVYSTRTFIIPVICFTVLYNVSKFFELEIVHEKTLTLQNGTTLYSDIIGNMTFPADQDYNTTHVLQPTALRLDSMYITIYILWMNLIFNILGPFIVLAVLNHIVSLSTIPFKIKHPGCIIQM